LLAFSEGALTFSGRSGLRYGMVQTLGWIQFFNEWGHYSRILEREKHHRDRLAGMSEIGL
jgi:hypothetical protein